MANTTGGLPYPVGTDFVVDGDNAIRALAESTDARTTYGGLIQVRQSSAQSGYPGATWFSVPFDQTPYTIRPAVPPGVRWDYAARAFVIQTAGVYFVWATVTMTGGTYSMRIRHNGERTLALQTATSQSYTVSTSAVSYLPSGAQILVQVFVVSGTLSTPADTNDNPLMFGITHLPQIP